MHDRAREVKLGHKYMYHSCTAYQLTKMRCLPSYHIDFILDKGDNKLESSAGLVSQAERRLKQIVKNTN